MANTQDALRVALRKAIFAIPDENLISRDIIFNAIDSALSAQDAAQPTTIAKHGAHRARSLSDAHLTQYYLFRTAERSTPPFRTEGKREYRMSEL